MDEDNKQKKEIPALGDSAYLLVCRRHATLLALCNTHGGRGGARSVRVALAVASRPSTAATAAAAATSATATATAQHVTPLDDIAASRATVGSRSFPGTVGGAPCSHNSRTSRRRASGLGHEHGDATCRAGGDRDSQGRAGGGSLGARGWLALVVLACCGLGVQRGVGVGESARTTVRHTK